MPTEVVEREEARVDITSLLSECASTLTYSNPILCNEESFSLHDSMAALELMDRKMDCCELTVQQVNPILYQRQQEQEELKNKSNHDQQDNSDNTAINTKTPKDDASSSTMMVPPRKIPTGLFNEEICPLPWDGLSLSDAVEIGLQILIRLEAFLGGASVAESTYTCLYSHSAVLADIRQIVMVERPSAEESNDESSLVDRFGAMLTANSNSAAAPSSTEASTHVKPPSRPSTFQYSKLSKPQLIVYAQTLGLVETSNVVRSIVLHADIYEEEDFSVNTFGLQFFEHAAEGETSRILKYALEQIESNEEHGEDSDVMESLRLMLTIQLQFLEACEAMAKLNAATVLETIPQVKIMIQSGVSSLKSLFTRMEALSSSSPNAALLQSTFDAHIYRPLVGSAPVRKVSFKTIQQALPTLITIFSELDWAVCDLLLHGSSLMKIQRMLNRVSLSAVNIVSRSLIILNLYFDDLLLGQHSLGILIGRELSNKTGLEVALLQSKIGTAFLNRLAKPMYDTLKLFVLNRNRQRTYLEAIMFADWAALQQEAHVVDANHGKEFQYGNAMPPYYTQYALYKTVQLMEHYVGLGLELKLYCGHFDLSVAYWYRDFLLSSLLNTMSSMRRTRLMAQKHAVANGNSTQQQNNGNHHNKYGQLNPEEEKQEELDFLVVGLRRSLCRGIVRFIAALNQADLLRAPVYDFTSHQSRFEKRFESFNCIVQPPPLVWDDYVKGSDFANVAQKDLLSSTSDCFQTCKKMLDNVSTILKDDKAVVSHVAPPLQEDQVRGLAKVCVGNSVFLMKLTQQLGKDGKAGAGNGKVVFDFETNKQFCTVKIESK